MICLKMNLQIYLHLIILLKLEKRNIEYTYHKPLLIKNKDSNTYNQDAIDFINNSVLPNSSEKNSTFQYTIPWKNYINTSTE